jgi:5'-nucleotidase
MHGIAAALAALLLAAGCATAPGGPVTVKLLAINDFHGALQPPAGGLRAPDPADATKSITVNAGGAERLATAVAEAKAKNPHHLFVAAGDLIGATPLLSALFRDEPTVEALSAMGLALSAVGNHEFDRGAAELLRLQRGGCHPTEGCKGPAPYRGAGFQWLAASTVDTATGRTILPATAIRRFAGIPVGFIGLTLRETPSIVVPSGVAGLRFDDEAATVNALVPTLRAQGVEAIVVLVHEGGAPVGLDVNGCSGVSGPIVGIVEKLDPAVDVVISGHTHRAYNCRIAGKLVTSADKYGTLFTEIDVVLDPATRDVLRAEAVNRIVAPGFAKDARQTALIAAYEALARPLAQRVVGRIAAPLPRDDLPSGEIPVGRVVADAQLEATRDAGAQIALMNPGGLRAPLGRAAGELRYEELFAVQPFWNNLVTVTLTGAQLVQALEQQWLNQPRPRVLQVSRGFSYTWDAGRPAGQRVVPGSVKLDGRAIAPDERLRVTINSFLAGGGDNFSVFKAHGAEPRTGVMDIDALEAWVSRQGVLSAPSEARIVRLPAP